MTSSIAIVEPRRRLVVVARVLLGAFRIEAMVRRSRSRKLLCRIALRGEQVSEKGRNARARGGFSNFLRHVFSFGQPNKEVPHRKTTKHRTVQYASECSRCEIRSFIAEFTPMEHYADAHAA